MLRFTLSIVAILLTSNVAIATEQLADKLFFGGREYAIREVPMLGLWDFGGQRGKTGKQKPPAFEVRSSANWVGYEAQFEIRNSKLFLRRITGWIDGKQRENEEIIPGERFPIVASWYTGKIHLAVGDFDFETQESTAVMIFEIEKGLVKSVDFAERMKPVWTWNGVPEKADLDIKNGERVNERQRN